MSRTDDGDHAEFRELQMQCGLQGLGAVRWVLFGARHARDGRTVSCQ